MNEIEELQLRLSVSKTKCFDQCKKLFYFSYIQKLPKKDRDYHIFGKFCHKVLEDFHRFYIEGSTDPFNKSMSKSFKNAQAEFKNQMTAEMTKECFNLILEYLKIVSLNPEKNLKNVLSVEKQFYFPISDKVILNGMIDKIQIDDDNVLHVADYKTTKNKEYLTNDFFQLLTYAYVMVQENPDITKIRASYILLRHNFEYITTEFDVSEILTIKDKYLKYANDILSETEYKPTTSQLCRFCDHLSICLEGKDKVGSYGTYGEQNW